MAAFQLLYCLYNLCAFPPGNHLFCTPLLLLSPKLNQAVLLGCREHTMLGTLLHSSQMGWLSQGQAGAIRTPVRGCLEWSTKTPVSAISSVAGS